MRLPDDPRTRRILGEYLEHCERGTLSWRALEADDLDFRGAVLDGVNLQSAMLYGACLDGVSLRHADLDAARGRAPRQHAGPSQHPSAAPP
ncbi:MAG: pentapeptide repeat-containing protein, partial [Actinobacteria bacterium]|nr:pentapeptide repeat-containing protein [Actinomycetota bacterium]